MSKLLPIIFIIVAGVHFVMLSPAGAQTAESTGKLMHIDRAAAQIILNHGAIANLNVAPTSSIFRIKDIELLRGIQLGDYAKFHAERIDGELTVIKIKKSDEDLDEHQHH